MLARESVHEAAETVGLHAGAKLRTKERFHGVDLVLRLNLGTILPEGAQHFGAVVLFSEDLAPPVGAGRHIGGFRGVVGFPGGERGPAGLPSVAESPEHLDFHGGWLLRLAFSVGFPRVAWGIDGNAVVIFADRFSFVPNRQTVLLPLCFGHGVPGFAKSAFMVHGVIRNRRRV
jgi:hypothetical protein